MSEPRRNDPCPCGSGRKFKRCCGTARPVNTGIRDAGQDAALEQLQRFTRREEFAPDRSIAGKMFWATQPDEFPEEMLEELRDTEMITINFSNFLTFDLEIEDGKTLVDIFLERRGRSLISSERRFLERLSASHVGLYEIIEVRAGEGLRLRNLWGTAEDIWVAERTASRTLCRWDLLATRLVAEPSGERFMEGDMYPFPAHFKQRVFEFLEGEQRRATAGGRTLSCQAFLKRVSFRFHGLWLESILPEMPQLGTFDGEPLAFSTLRFAIESTSRLVRALDACEELQDEEGDRWVYLAVLDGIYHLIGDFRIEGNELVVVVMSNAHGKDARALLERIAGDALRYVGTEESDGSELKQLGRPVCLECGADGNPDEPPSAESLAVVKRAMEQHYRRWLDDEIPALGGSTPRAAAADDRLRPQLVDLLKQMENQEQRRPSGIGGVYDFGWVRRELGL